MDRDEIVRSYASAWEESDEARRRKLLDATWSPDGMYCDRMGRAEGPQALMDLIAAYQGQVPGLRVELTTGVDGHNEFGRFGWKILKSDGSLAAEGVDFATFGPDGRITQIVGFSGPLPQTES